MENRIYLFVPFRFDRAGTLFSAAVRRAHLDPRNCDGDASADWCAFASRPLSYFLKYFTDKICYCCDGKGDDRIGNGDEDARTVAIERHGYPVGCKYRLCPLERLKDDFRTLDLAIQGVNMFLFQTGVGLVSFGIELEADDVKTIAEAEFLLKQAAEPLGTDGRQIQIDDGKRKTTFLELARDLVRLFGPETSNAGDGDGFAFFSEKPRASMLTWVLNEGETGATYDEEFYYLRNGYGRSYYYSDELKGGALDGRGADADSG